MFEHFTDVSKTIKMPTGAEKTVLDYKLTRYACYLIAQNGDSRKKVIALAQTYFAVQTKKQEISEKNNEQNPLGYSIGKNICVGKDYKNGSESFTSKVCKTIVALKNKGINTTAIVDGVDDALGEHLKSVINLLEKEKSEHTTSEKTKITPLEINSATEATLINKPGLLGNLVTKVKGILGVKKEKNERYK